MKQTSASRIFPRAAHVLVSTFGAAALLCTPLAHAEQADSGKPLVFDAANLSYDDLKQITVLTGDVVLTKGTIVIRADRVEIRTDPQGYQYAQATMNSNKLAYFRQKRDAVDEYIEGNAKRIDYDGRNEVTTLTGQAIVKRLAGLSTVIDQVQGNQIRYEQQTDRYTATSSAGTTSGGRVRGMLGPRNGGAAPLQGRTSLTPSTSVNSSSQP
ncbi:lipopolysaccharide transport periplasmic protein LptA [Chitinasiproducens palmae]|uniref:Lipopolysaccharide export system protein LptA n=1 Tax=Chitinasiproducens palmae TaxID=1770053 RepID=A0A1H2PPH3_9BURK|nr:lipopolysaccharide transport periplasmic protein LptA [Chitinasiproducens palmae]SDV48203.1 lipopolysaccharide export system protein LptA [Chitinasiproducens palmae]